MHLLTISGQINLHSDVLYFRSWIGQRFRYEVTNNGHQAFIMSKEKRTCILFFLAWHKAYQAAHPQNP